MNDVVPCAVGNAGRGYSRGEVPAVLPDMCRGYLRSYRIKELLE